MSTSARAKRRMLHAPTSIPISSAVLTPVGAHRPRTTRRTRTGTSDEITEPPPRFLADEGFNMDVTLGLRRRYPAMDIMTVQEAGLLHVDDRALLQATQR